MGHANSSPTISREIDSMLWSRFHLIEACHFIKPTTLSTFRSSFRCFSGERNNDHENRRSLVPWTEAEDRRMVQLRRDGYTYASIAATLGRTRSAVGHRFHDKLIREYGIQPPATRREFTGIEDDLICTMREAGETFPAIAAALPEPRTSRATLNRYSNLQSGRGLRRGKQSWWSSAEVQMIAILKEQGTARGDVALYFPSRSPSSIMERFDALTKEGVARRNHFYTSEDDDLLIDARRRGLTSSEIRGLLPARTLRSLDSRTSLLRQRGLLGTTMSTPPR